MYVTPLNIDPEKPALPISHPFIYSVYLAKLLGRFITLGEANDTWALNEGALDERAFLELTYANHAEWEAMLQNALKKTPRGVVAIVFETTDSIQHMFFRYLDKAHPALKSGPAGMSAAVIEELYKKMDDLVGRVAAGLGEKGVLFVMSDHGFKSFRRGVNLNSWLRRNGYLHLAPGKERERRVVQGRRLVADEGLWPRPRRRLPQPQGPRGPGHRRDGGRSGRPESRARRQARRAAGRPGRARRDHARLRPRRRLRRSVQGQRARPHHRLQRGLPGLVGRRHGHRRRRRHRGQRQGLERRPLHRPRARARGPLLEPQDQADRPVDHGRRADRPGALRDRAAGPHGRARSRRHRRSRRRETGEGLMSKARQSGPQPQGIPQGRRRRVRGHRPRRRGPIHSQGLRPGPGDQEDDRPGARRTRSRADTKVDR